MEQCKMVDGLFGFPPSFFFPAFIIKTKGTQVDTGSSFS